MRGDRDNGDSKVCLHTVVSLINHASELAKRSVETAEAGQLENAINIAAEVELLLDEARQRLAVAFEIHKSAVSS